MKLILTLLLTTFSFVCMAANTPYGYNNLKANTYLNKRYLPDTTNAFGWQEFNASYDNTNTVSPWIGSQDLTVWSPSGSLSATNDHLGRQNAVSLNGTDQFLYNSDSTFDNANEAFTAWAWVKPDSVGSFVVLAGKADIANNYRSWYMYLGAEEISYVVSYDGTNSVALSGTDVNYFNDNNWHFVAMSYNPDADGSNGSVLGFVDGKVDAYKLNSNIYNTRYNDSNTALAFGASDVESTPDKFLDGSIAEIFYKKTALTANELRKIYCAGSRADCKIVRNDKVVVSDGSGYTGEVWVNPKTVAPLNATSFTAVPTFELYAWEAGHYVVEALTGMLVKDNNSDGTVIVRFDIYNDTQSQVLTRTGNHRELGGDFFTGTTPIIRSPLTLPTRTVYINKDDKIVFRYFVTNSGDYITVYGDGSEFLMRKLD